jgi:hypothetical protein
MDKVYLFKILGRFSYYNGDEYFGEWTEDLKNGKGVYKYNNGDKYEGDWQRGLIHGRGKY